ncbi:MAG: hypothetical protein OIN85_01100 [Candidatus Methanoperedens sp.]|nr:hypothetical protein [Candidatus Methanoperedens sp.]
MRKTIQIQVKDFNQIISKIVKIPKSRKRLIQLNKKSGIHTMMVPLGDVLKPISAFVRKYDTAVRSKK